MQEDAVRPSLRRAARILDRLTDRWFLAGGSCLGYLRGGRPIAWDTDLDIGVYDPSLDLGTLGRHLPVVQYVGFGGQVTVAVLWVGLRLDIYRFFDHEGRVAETTYHLGRGEVKLLLYPKAVLEAGVGRGVFCGTGCNVLARAHEYCRTLYGESYMVPDPAYDWWDGPRNAVVLHPGDIFDRHVTSLRGEIAWHWQADGPLRLARRAARRLLRPLGASLSGRAAPVSPRAAVPLGRTLDPADPPSGDQAQDPEEDHAADERDEDRPEVQPGDPGAAEEVEEPPSDDAADHADDEVSHEAAGALTGDDHPGEPSADDPHDDPHDDVSPEHPTHPFPVLPGPGAGAGRTRAPALGLSPRRPPA